MSEDMRRRRLIVLVVAVGLTSSCAGVYDWHPVAGFFVGMFVGFGVIVGYELYDRRFR